jgi:phage terminase Nu1 subunit (DNA packaging protein)
MAMQAKLWTASGIAVETGFTQRAVMRALTKCPVADKKGRANCYWLRDALPLLYGNESRGIDLGEQRARQHREMADKLEMENQVTRGELVRAPEIAQLWGTLTTELRQRLMMIPARVGDQVARAKRKTSAKKIIEKEIRDALEGLAASRAGLSPGPEIT